MTKTLSLLLSASAMAFAAPALAQDSTMPAGNPDVTSPSQPAAPTADMPGTAPGPDTTMPDTPMPENGTPPSGMPHEATTPTAPVAPAEGTVSAVVASNAELSTLASALTAADLVATLNSGGPYTVFAPTNQAFGLIAEGTRAQLMSPAQKPALATLLKHHVVAGNLTAADLRARIEAGGGTATIETVAGQTLRASLENGNVVLMGENNSKAYVTEADVEGGNGTIHVVNGILVPRLG